jgi:beta-glucosidase/6-phospho-beta-glucosidase/beta-galactosidase
MIFGQAEGNNNYYYFWLLQSLFVQTGSPYINTVPYGIEKVVMYFKTRYNNTPIYVTENGMSSNHFFIFWME